MRFKHFTKDELEIIRDKAIQLYVNEDSEDTSKEDFSRWCLAEAVYSLLNQKGLIKEPENE